MIAHRYGGFRPAASVAAGVLRVPGIPWAPAVLALVTIVAFWRPFVASLPLLGAENAAGLAPVMPALVTWLAVAAVARRARLGLPLRGSSDEAVIDLPVAAILMGVAGWLVWQAPSQYG